MKRIIALLSGVAMIVAASFRMLLEWARLVAGNVMDRMTSGFEYVMCPPVPVWSLITLELVVYR